MMNMTNFMVQDEMGVLPDTNCKRQTHSNSVMMGRGKFVSSLSSTSFLSQRLISVFYLD